MRTLILFIFPLVLSCNLLQEEEQHAATIARVGDDYLYLSDIAGVVPADASPEDSTLVIDNYIQGWIKEKLVLKKAEENLKDNQKDFQKQLDDYRKSLVIYTYEKELMKQKLDTVVSQEEISAFYEENKQNFELRDDIVKVRYLKLLKSAPGVKKVRKIYQSDKEKDVEKLKELAHQYAEKFHLDDHLWIVFDELKKEVPISVSQNREYLKNVKNIEVEDSLSYYFVRINDYKLQDDVAPLSFEANNIRNIIINKRKLKLINQVKSDLYQQAFLNKKIEIYKTPKNEK
ncbi:MAG: hypothetical protein KDD41_10025 [Flavobacteriales bacterium]|nr:hypothetical protein [Flavobacteriales bacterium]